jgi:hypothetical protein
VVITIDEWILIHCYSLNCIIYIMITLCGVYFFRLWQTHHLICPLLEW